MRLGQVAFAFALVSPFLSVVTEAFELGAEGALTTVVVPCGLVSGLTVNVSVAPPLETTTVIEPSGLGVTVILGFCPALCLPVGGGLCFTGGVF